MGIKSTEHSNMVLLILILTFLLVLFLAFIADRYMLFSDKRTLPWAFNGEYDGGVVTYKIPAMSDCMFLNSCPAEVIGYKHVSSIPVDCRYYPLERKLRCVDMSTGFVGFEATKFTIVNIT